MLLCCEMGCAVNHIMVSKLKRQRAEAKAALESLIETGPVSEPLISIRKSELRGQMAGIDYELKQQEI